MCPTLFPGESGLGGGIGCDQTCLCLVCFSPLSSSGQFLLGQLCPLCRWSGLPPTVSAVSRLWLFLPSTILRLHWCLQVSEPACCAMVANAKCPQVGVPCWPRAETCLPTRVSKRPCCPTIFNPTSESVVRLGTPKIRPAHVPFHLTHGRFFILGALKSDQCLLPVLG